MIEWLNEIPVAIQIILGLAMFFPAMFGGIMIVAIVGTIFAIGFALAVIAVDAAWNLAVWLWRKLWK